MKDKDVKITISYKNDDEYKHILMDYIIKFILDKDEGSIDVENDRK